MQNNNSEYSNYYKLHTYETEKNMYLADEDLSEVFVFVNQEDDTAPQWKQLVDDASVKTAWENIENFSQDKSEVVTQSSNKKSEKTVISHAGSNKTIFSAITDVTINAFGRMNPFGARGCTMHAVQSEPEQAVDTDTLELRDAVNVIIENMEGPNKTLWGDGQGNRSPEQESLFMRETKDTFLVGAFDSNSGDVHVSKQVNLDFGRAIGVKINDLIIEQDKRNPSATYGVKDNEWNAEGNKLLTIFHVLDGAICATPQGKDLDRLAVQELIHTTLEGCTQTFDAALTNLINEGLALMGATFVNSSKTPPSVSIRVVKDHLVVTRTQPMVVKSALTMKAYPAELKRSFELDIGSGKTTPTEGFVTVEWDKGESLG